MNMGNKGNVSRHYGQTKKRRRRLVAEKNLRTKETTFKHVTLDDLRLSLTERRAQHEQRHPKDDGIAKDKTKRVPHVEIREWEREE
tara:strand:+ start:1063 stop:1320 length:258 start_codon:yes stop_codon:yes gene_type:complete